jgi:hypothetical protein
MILVDSIQIVNVIEKETFKFKELEPVLIEKVEHFF